MKKYFWWLIGGLVGLSLIVRVWQVTQSPAAPYWEEVALGYDAYSMALTGKDHHGHPWPIIAFESFGDWKPSGYFYALVPFVKTLGLSVFTVRLPSVIAGTSMVIGLAVLAWQLTTKALKTNQRRLLVLLVTLIASISPWLIQFSRGGWEVNLATALMLWGIIFGWQAINLPAKNKNRFIWLVLTILALFAAMYTYHSVRLTAPILGLWFGWQFIGQDLRTKSKNIWLVGYILPLFLTSFLLRPFAVAINTSALGQRAAETSVLTDSSIVLTSNQLKDSFNNSLFSRLVYHRYVIATEKVAEQFVSHFNLDFLFINGDGNPRHSSQYFGLFYPFELLFLLVGCWWIWHYLPVKQRQLLAIWLVFGMLPAALTKTVPHALRILPTAPVWLFATAVGLWQCWQWLIKLVKKERLVAGLVILVYGLSFMAFYRHLLLVYPASTAHEWQAGYQQLVTTVEQLRQEHPELPTFITREQGRPAMYYWFYTKTDPVLVQQAELSVPHDQGEFLQFNNIYFVNSLSDIPAVPAIVASSPQQFALLGDQVMAQDISNLAGEIVWRVGVIEN